MQKFQGQFKLTPIFLEIIYIDIKRFYTPKKSLFLAINFSPIFIFEMNLELGNQNCYSIFQKTCLEIHIWNPYKGIWNAWVNMFTYMYMIYTYQFV